MSEMIKAIAWESVRGKERLKRWVFRLQFSACELIFFGNLSEINFVTYKIDRTCVCVCVCVSAVLYVVEFRLSCLLSDLFVWCCRWRCSTAVNQWKIATHWWMWRTFSSGNGSVCSFQYSANSATEITRFPSLLRSCPIRTLFVVSVT